MVIEKLKEFLGPNKLDPNRADALQDLIDALKGVLTGKYESPKKALHKLNSRLQSRGKDFRKLQQKLRDNESQLREVESKLAAMGEDLVIVDEDGCESDFIKFSKLDPEDR
jgi:chromosome segregation ATPase